MTRAVPIHPFFNKLDKWTWRINTSAFTAPGNTETLYDDNIDVSDQRVAQTTYSFEWPAGQGDTLTDALNGTKTTLWTTVYQPLNNVTSLYTEDDMDSADCTPVLGEACLEAMRTATTRSSFHLVEECMDEIGTYATAQSVLPRAWAFAIRGNDTRFGNETEGLFEGPFKRYTGRDWVNGRHGFFDFVYEDEDGSEFEKEATKLHMIHLQFSPPDELMGHIEVPPDEPMRHIHDLEQWLRMRVRVRVRVRVNREGEATRGEDESADNFGVESSGSEGNENGEEGHAESAAASMRIETYGTLYAALGAFVFGLL